ncbi:glycosyltransferase family 4 protein [Paenibacillus lentus]|uniref:Glycosyltransferase family 1 protein n=1 Tax=Paenibacillus lentus TaxID=1338368 RepID=A0A3Q8SCI8_9BACL|nr:glycosyltransferase family 4 protein [Paenibacillus lentus]AZK47586.1 glycosyltransferase family 1 protein [Paenibacillus lentus]
MPSKRRLAIIDSKFPWKLSGFRYWENIQFHTLRPDTLFFATEPYSDDFPAAVHPFSQFKDLAVSEEITDVYCVFLNMVLSLLGKCTLPDGTHMPGSNPYLDIQSFLVERQIKLHTTLYPGGGLVQETRPEFLELVNNHCSTIFTNIEDILSKIDKSIYQPVVINTNFYNYIAKSWTCPIQLVFSAFNYPRKGFPLLIDTFNRLDSDDFHLHIVGDWDNQLAQLTNQRFTFHGVMVPEQLKSLYQSCEVFINCSTSDGMALDGFPTTAAVDAMSTGCLLVTTNPRNDQLILQEGIDYLKINPDEDSLFHALCWIRDHVRKARHIATHGAKTIQSRFQMEQIVKEKLSHMLGNR